MATLVAICASAAAQAPTRSAATKPKREDDDSSIRAVQHEIESRLTAAAAAIRSNDAARIVLTSQAVIAIGLRQMADLRMLEGNYDAGVALYEQSLKFEHDTSVPMKLGIAYMRLGRNDEAITQAEGLIRLHSEDAEAWRLKGNAYASKQDFAEGAAALAHSLKLKGDLETAYGLAVCFLSMHDGQKARMVFDDMARNYGNSGALHVLMGRAYRDAGDDALAMAEFHRAIQLDPKSPHAHYFIALMMLIKSEWQATNPEIEKQLRAELQLNPADYLTNYLLGFAALQRREFDLAEKCLRKAADLNPEQPEAWLYLGMSAFDQQDYAGSEPLLRKAIALTGSDESRNNYQVRRAYIDLARILSSHGETDEAKPLFEKARQLQQRTLEQTQQRVSKMMVDAGATPGMGAVVSLASKQIEAGDNDATSAPTTLAGEQIEKARAQEKYLRTILGSGFNDLGSAYAHQHNFQSALEAFEAADQWAPETPGLARNLGLAAGRAEKYSEAAAALSRQVVTQPEDQVAWAMLGIAQFNLENYGDATVAFAHLDSQSAADPRLGLPWAASLAKSGDFNRAAMILKPFEQQSLPPEMLLILGQTLGDIARYDEAIAVFNRALAAQPNLPRAHFDEGLAYLKSDRPAQAGAEFEKELGVSPDNVDAKYNLAFTLIQQSQNERALGLLTEIVATHPEHADAQYQLGKMLLDQSDLAGAIEHLEAAARISPEKAFVHYQLQAAYRRASRVADADRELELYKTAKARNREPGAIQP